MKPNQEEVYATTATRLNGSAHLAAANGDEDDDNAPLVLLKRKRATEEQDDDGDATLVVRQLETTTNGFHHHHHNGNSVDVSPLSCSSSSSSVPPLQQQQQQQTSHDSSIANGREKRIRKKNRTFDNDFFVFTNGSCLTTNAPSSQLSLNTPSASSASSSSNNSPSQSSSHHHHQQPRNSSSQYAAPSPSSHSSSAASTTSECCFLPGDLVWAKVSGHPWWPCMIDVPKPAKGGKQNRLQQQQQPLSHVKYVGSVRPKPMFYCIFYGPSRDHAWIPESSLLEYKGIEVFKNFVQEQMDAANTKSAKERLAERYQLKVTSSRKEPWEQALREADVALKKDGMERRRSIDEVSSKQREMSSKGAVASKVTQKRDSTNPASNESILRNAYDHEGDIDRFDEDVENDEDDEDYENDDDDDEYDDVLEEQSNLKETATKENAATSNEKSQLRAQQILALIKNRLSALTCFDTNLLNLDKIEQKYQIKVSLLMKDYFGFQAADEGETETATLDEKSQFFKKLELIKQELEVEQQQQNLSLSVPKALIALKHQVPMFFVKKLYEHLLAMKSPSPPLDKSANQLYDELFQLKLLLFQNRDSLTKLNEIMNQSTTMIVKKIVTQQDLNPKEEDAQIQ